MNVSQYNWITSTFLTETQINSSITAMVNQAFITALGFVTGTDIWTAISGNRTEIEATIDSVNTTANIESLNFTQGEHTVDTISNETDLVLSINETANIEALGFTQGPHTVSGDTNNDGLFVNYTKTKTTGNITNGSLVGYTAADEICNVEVDDGSHMCQMFEVINTVRLKGFGNFTATFRVSEGAPGFTTNANDCVGWRDDTGTFLGSIWVGNTDNGGQGALVSCDAERAIACCK